MEIKILDGMEDLTIFCLNAFSLLSCCIFDLTSNMTFAYLKIIFPTPLKVWGAWNFLLPGGALVEVLKKFLKEAGPFALG